MQVLHSAITGYVQTSQPGGERACTASTINLIESIRNLQNIKDKHADQPAKKKRATPYRTHVLPLVVNNSFSKMCVCARCFVHCYRARYVIRVLIM